MMFSKEMKDYVTERMFSEDVTDQERIALAHNLGKIENIEDLKIAVNAHKRRFHERVRLDEMGYFGNIWVRKLYFSTAAVIHEGHSHNHDHVSLLVSGSVKVSVNDVDTFYEAPTFVIIKAGEHHQITALEDNTTWFCVFAMRDKDGELIEHYEDGNSPYFDKEVSTH